MNIDTNSCVGCHSVFDTENTMRFMCSSLKCTFCGKCISKLKNHSLDSHCVACLAENVQFTTKIKVAALSVDTHEALSVDKHEALSVDTHATCNYCAVETASHMCTHPGCGLLCANCELFHREKSRHVNCTISLDEFSCALVKHILCAYCANVAIAFCSTCRDILCTACALTHTRIHTENNRLEFDTDDIDIPYFHEKKQYLVRMCEHFELAIRPEYETGLAELHNKEMDDILRISRISRISHIRERCAQQADHLAHMEAAEIEQARNVVAQKMQAISTQYAELQFNKNAAQHLAASVETFVEIQRTLRNSMPLRQLRDKIDRVVHNSPLARRVNSQSHIQNLYISSQSASSDFCKRIVPSPVSYSVFAKQDKIISFTPDSLHWKSSIYTFKSDGPNFNTKKSQFINVYGNIAFNYKYALKSQSRYICYTHEQYSYFTIIYARYRVKLDNISNILFYENDMWMTLSSDRVGIHYYVMDGRIQEWKQRLVYKKFIDTPGKVLSLCLFENNTILLLCENVMDNSNQMFVFVTKSGQILDAFSRSVRLPRILCVKTTYDIIFALCQDTNIYILDKKCCATAVIDTFTHITNFYVPHCDKKINNLPIIIDSGTPDIYNVNI
jgi:hypothetical protein